MSTLKIRETRVRKLLAREGMLLRKTPARSWLRQFHGVGYMVVDANRNVVVLGATSHAYDGTIEEVEQIVMT